MTLPASFARDGFLPPERIRLKRGLMIGTDGPANSGKTEFAISAPGPGIAICLDRGFDAMLDNPRPPKSRNPDWAFKVIQAPLATQARQDAYVAYWKGFYAEYVKATDNPDCRSLLVDGDSDSWELQRLAEFGKLTQIKSIHYAGVNAARRAMYARAYDSRKIVIATNKISKDYAIVYDDKGEPVMGDDGRPKREWDGKSYERQGFSDQDYLFQIQLRHIYKEAAYSQTLGKHLPHEWGIKIMRCKPNPELHGQELWGSDCNFRTLVELVYPQVDPKEWGFK